MGLNNGPLLAVQPRDRGQISVPAGGHESPGRGHGQILQPRTAISHPLGSLSSMCGRFSLYAEPTRVADRLGAKIRQAAFEDWHPSWNVAPTDPILGVRVTAFKGEPGYPTRDPMRILQSYRWGLIPHWVTDPAKAGPTFNARAETVASKPTFRSAFNKGRILVPADSYFEWTTVAGKKQPNVIRRADGDMLTFAGLSQAWRPPDDTRAWLLTATIITGPAGPDTAELHDRQPVVLEPDLWDAWLDPTNHDVDELQSMLRPSVQGTLQHYPVDGRVGNVRNNDSGCIEPLVDR